METNEYRSSSGTNSKRLFSYELIGRHGRDRMVVGFITTYAISAYQH
jgi:hypothetical protein